MLERKRLKFIRLLYQIVRICELDKMYSANTVINKFNRTLKSSLQRYTSIAYKYNGGRNSKGGITAYHRGGGSKTRYNLLASLESYLFEIPGVVVGFSTESNRNSLIALVSYANGVIA